MSQLSQLLLSKAEEIRLSSPTECAVEHLKQAGFSEEDARISVTQHLIEKEAANTLVSSGVDIEQAVALVKAANINLKAITSFEYESDVHPSVELLQKAAQYIDLLETELESAKSNVNAIEKSASRTEQELPEVFNQAASAGAFTNEDLAELQKMSPEILTKVASAFEEPWGMGHGTGMSRPKTDPFLEFLIG